MKQKLLFGKNIIFMFLFCFFLANSVAASASLSVERAITEKNSRAVSVDPTSFNENVLAGEFIETTLTITNSGASDLEFELYEYDVNKKNSGVARQTEKTPEQLNRKIVKGEEPNFAGSLTRDVSTRNGGPDGGGYFWISANYEWIDAQAGTPVTLSDDSYITGIPLGFTFDYYDEAYTTINIMSNGWVSFSNTNTWYPGCVPGWGGAIVPFGYDLNPAAGGTITYMTEGEVPFRRFIVEFNNVPRYGTSIPFTFQVVFYETTNKIKFQYLDVPEIPNSIGIENFDATYGMGNCAAGDLFIPTNIVANGVALEFYSSWLQFSATSGVVPAEDNVDVQLLFDATNLFDGIYEKNIVLSSNDPENPEVIVPVTLNVTGFPEIALSDITVDFGSVDAYQEYTYPITITNNGTADLQISDIAISNMDFVASHSDMIIPPMESEDLIITFYYETSGSFSGVLTLNTNVVGQEIIEIPLAAEILSYEVILAADPETSGTVEGAGTYASGEEVTISAIANEGFVLSYWDESGLVFSEEEVYSFNIHENKTLTAIFLFVPGIEVNPTSFNENVDAGDFIETTLTISNITAGSVDLEFELSDYDVNKKGSGVARQTEKTPEQLNRKIVKGENPNFVDPTTRDLSTRDGGPDGGNYFWKTTGFSWIDAQAGTTVSLGDDDFVTDIPLGFAFNYYDETYSTINIMSNGWVSFTNSDTWYPNCVPAWGGAIAPFGRDLNPASGGTITYMTEGEAPFRKFVVEFNAVPRFGTSNYHTFQVIFYETTNKIKFQYLDVPEIPTSIGIENFDATYGMGNCAAGDLYIPTNIVANGIALEFYTTWLQFSATSGVVPAEDNVDIQLLFDATDLFDGVYEKNIVVSSNDPNNPEVVVPVTLNVTGYPDIDLSENSIDFGSVGAGQEHTLPLVITNSGTKLLEVSNIQITSEYFTLSDTEFSLSPQTSETLYITFYSDEAVDIDQLLILNTNVEGEDLIYMPVSAQVNAYDVVLLVNPVEGGVVDGEGSYLHGEEVTVRAFPSSGDWMFISWTEGGSVVSEDNVYTFIIDSDITLTANFEQMPEISVDPASFEEYVDAGDIITRTLTVSNIGVAGSELDVELFVQDPGLKNRQALNPQIIPGTIKSNEKFSGDKKGSFDISEISRTEENSKAGGKSLLFISTLAASGANFSAQLQALPNVGYYEEFDARIATPNTEYMQQFDVVFVASNEIFADPALLGNNLAEYVDLGGNVCIMQGTMSAGGNWALGGTIMTETYSPLNSANFSVGTTNTCENFENHPVNNGVTTVSTDIFGHSVLQGNSMSLGTYNSGDHVGAVNMDKPIVALNVFPADGYWSGDLMLMLENTIDHFGINWLFIDPQEATIADGGFFEFEVTFDATDLIDGVYEKEIVVLSNDPFNPEVIVPVTLHVTGYPEIELSDIIIDFGTVDAFVENVYPLTITNIGTANLEITGFIMQDNVFGHNGVDMILAPGDSEVVDITLYSETAGLFSDVLSFNTNIEGSETIFVNIMAEILTYDVTLDENPLEGGSTTGAGTYAQNEVVTLTAVPEVDWIFVSWEEAGVVVSEDMEYTFNIQSDRIITANFAFAPSITVNPEFFNEEMLAGDIMTRTLTVSNNGVAGSELIVSVEVADIEKDLNKNETRADNFSVLYLEANANADAAFKTELQNSAVIETLDIVNVSTQTPDAASMLNYQTVIVSSGGNVFQDPVALGNNLAEYVDLGGSVILLNACFSAGGGYTLGGNIMTADYSPVTVEAYTNANTVCNSFVEHSLTTSVNSISTTFYSQATLQGAGVSLGSYDAGYLVAAYNPDKPVMAINILPFDGLWSGDVMQMIENAVVYYKALWLSVDLEDAVIPEGTSQDFILTFDATNLIEGVYEKNVVITSNDVVNPVVIVPVTLTVTGIPEIVVSPDDIDFGVVTADQAESVFLDISNAGTGTLNITNIATTDPSFVAQATDMTILPNSSDQLEIVFSADIVGNYSDVLSFTTDDPLNENISISMFAEIKAPPVIEVTPESLYETLLVNETSEQIITVSNIGVDTQPLNWSASTFLPTKESINLFNYPASQGDFNSLAIFSKYAGRNEASYNYSREIFDLIDYFPVANGEGEFGVVTDGNFIYTARWNSNEIYKYELNGTFIEEFTIAGVSNILELTYDGEYFYAVHNGNNVIYQLDFNTQTLIGTITIPSYSISITYDNNNDAFWVANAWDAPLTLIDRDGTVLESISLSIGGIAGLAYDNVTTGGPYIWAITHSGNGNDLHQINIDDASIVMTFDVTTTGVIAGGVNSGGLQITDQLIPGKSVFLGTSQNDVIWVLDHASMSWLSVSPDSGTLLPGESIDLTVTFNSNGLAEGIYEGVVIVSSDDPVNPEISVPATLEVEYLYYSIFATSVGNGILSPEGEILVLHKEDQIFNIEADIGYHITDVVVDDVSVGPISEYTFTEVLEGHTINALFDINTYTITASSSAGGSIAPDGETVVDFGSTLDVTITPDEGYYIVDVFVDGVSMGAINAYTFEDISDDHTIHAEFEIFTYVIDVVASPYEGGILTGGGIYEHGELVTLAAYPDIPDYTFVYWTESGVQLSTELTYEFTATEDRHIVGYFRGANEYIVNAVADDPAHGLVEGGGSYEEGQEVSLNAIPNYGFVFDNWSGYAESADNPYVFTMPAEDINFIANFSVATYEITASVEGNGSIDPEGVIVVEHGANQAFIITSETGYHIEDVLVDGVSVGAVDTYTFEDIADNHSIHAVFAIDMFEIIASADANGAIYPSGIIDVEYGSDYTFSIVPDVGYEVSAILIDGVDAGSAGTYTFENITESHTIHAEFAIGEYLLTVLISPEGAGNVSTVPDNDVFNFGDEVSITAEANVGYAFVKWIDVDAVELSTEEAYSFNMPDENYTIIALFDIQPGVNETSLLNVSMYPNPSDGVFTVVSDHLMLEMVVFDMIGKEVYRANPDSDIANISLPEIEPGMYFVRISTIMGSKTIKLQIMK